MGSPGFGLDLAPSPAQQSSAGHSAGAGLAAGVALLMCPMLDDRERTPSSTALDGVGVGAGRRTGWDGRRRWANGGAGRTSARTQRRRGRGTSPGLAPAYPAVGAVGTFRDEVVEHARRIWPEGGDAEVHVRPGGYHCVEIVAPEAEVSRRAPAARAEWMARNFARSR